MEFTDSELEQKLRDEILSSVSGMGHATGLTVNVRVKQASKTIEVSVRYRLDFPNDPDYRTAEFAYESLLNQRILEGFYFTLNNYYVPDNQFYVRVSTPHMSHSFSRVVYDRDIYPLTQKYGDKYLNPSKYV